MKWPSNNRSINFLFKYKMNYINYYIIKMTVNLKTVLHKYCKNSYFYIIIIIVTIKEITVLQCLWNIISILLTFCRHIVNLHICNISAITLQSAILQ